MLRSDISRWGGMSGDSWGGGGAMGVNTRHYKDT